VVKIRREIKNWWKQAQADFTSAEHLLQTGDYYFSVFACHQAVEKGLKALVLLRLRKISTGHSLIYLAQLLKVPNEIFKITQNLNAEYITTRYPDVADAAPVDIYNKDIAKEHLDGTKRIIEWLKIQIEK